LPKTVNFSFGEARLDGDVLPSFGLYASLNSGTLNNDAVAPIADVLVTGTSYAGFNQWLYLVSGQHVFVPNARLSGLHIQDNESFAVDFWVSSNQFFPAGSYNIIHHQDTSTLIGWQVFFNDIGKLAVIYKQFGQTSSAYSSTTSIAAGLHHCFVVFDKEQRKIRTYIDGVQDATTSNISGSASLNVGQDLAIGSYHHNSNISQLSGLLGHIRVYAFDMPSLPYDLSRIVKWSFRNPGKVHPVISGSMRLWYKFDDTLNNSYFADYSAYSHSGVLYDDSLNQIPQVFFGQSTASHLLPIKSSGYWNDDRGSTVFMPDYNQPDIAYIQYPIASGIHYHKDRGSFTIRWKPSETATTISGTRIIFNGDGIGILYFSGDDNKYYFETMNVSGQWVVCSSFNPYSFSDLYQHIGVSWDSKKGIQLFVSGSYAGHNYRTWEHKDTDPKSISIGGLPSNDYKIIQVVSGTGDLTNETRIRWFGPKAVITSGCLNGYYIEPVDGPESVSGLIFRIKDSRTTSDGYDEIVIGESASLFSGQSFNIVNMSRAGESEYRYDDKYYALSGYASSSLVMSGVSFMIEGWVKLFKLSGLGDHHTIYKKNGSDGNAMQHIYFTTAGIIIGYSLHPDGSNVTLTSSALVFNSWYHFSLLDNYTSRTARLFLNGVKVDEDIY